MNQDIEEDDYDEDRERNEEEAREENREHARELEEASLDDDREHR